MHLKIKKILSGGNLRPYFLRPIEKKGDQRVYQKIKVF